MEPKYYAFLEVIGHPNRSSSENMTIDAEGMLTTHDRTLPTLASLASVSSTASPLPRFFNKGRMVGWGQKKMRKNMWSMAGFLKNKTHVTCSIAEITNKKHMPGD